MRAACVCRLARWAAAHRLFDIGANLRLEPLVRESDEMARRFVREQLSKFDIERTESIGGEVVDSQAMAELCSPLTPERLRSRWAGDIAAHPGRMAST